MKRSRPGALIFAALLGLLGGYAYDTVRASSGHVVGAPPWTFPLTLVIIAVVVVWVAYPVRRAVHSKTPVRVDPFRAARIAVLAKACAVGGAFLGGVFGGVVVFLLTRTVVVPGLLRDTIFATASGVVLLIAGLVAEWFCTLPPPPDSEDSSAPSGQEHD